MASTAEPRGARAARARALASLGRLHEACEAAREARKTALNAARQPLSACGAEEAQMRDVDVVVKQEEERRGVGLGPIGPRLGPT